MFENLPLTLSLFHSFTTHRSATLSSATHSYTEKGRERERERGGERETERERYIMLSYILIHIEVQA